MAWVKPPPAPPQLQPVVKFHAATSSVVPARQPAAARDCMQAIDDNVVQEESPERFPRRSNGRPAAHIEVSDDESD